MKAKIFKNNEWKTASKDDFIELIKNYYGINIESLDKVNINVNGKWVKGNELIEDKITGGK